MDIQSARDSVNPRRSSKASGAIVWVIAASLAGYLGYTYYPNVLKLVLPNVCSDKVLINFSAEDCFDFISTARSVAIPRSNGVRPNTRIVSSAVQVPQGVDAIVSPSGTSARNIEMRVFDVDTNQWGDWIGGAPFIRLREDVRFQIAMTSPLEPNGAASVELQTFDTRQTVAVWVLTTSASSFSERLDFKNTNVPAGNQVVISDPARVEFEREVRVKLISDEDFTEIRISGDDGIPRQDWMKPTDEFILKPDDIVELRTRTPLEFGDVFNTQILRSEDSVVIGSWRVSHDYEFFWRTTDWTTCPIPVLSYWGEWGACSQSCGGGTQTRSRTCFIPEDAASTREVECIDAQGKRVPETLCIAAKPSDRRECGIVCDSLDSQTRTCNLQACSGYAWEAGDWGSCRGASFGPWDEWSTCTTEQSCGRGTQMRSRVCTSPGTQTRTIRCVDANGRAVSSDFCLGEAPPSEQECQEGGCNGNLESSRSCSVTCSNDDSGRANDIDTSSSSSSTGSSSGATITTSPRSGTTESNEESVSDAEELDDASPTPNDNPPPADEPPPADNPPAEDDPRLPRTPSAASACLLAIENMTITSIINNTLNASTCLIHAGGTIRLIGRNSIRVDDICSSSGIFSSEETTINSNRDRVCSALGDPYTNEIVSPPTIIVEREGGTFVSTGDTTNSRTLLPGLYRSLVRFDGDWDITLNPGVYVFRGGFQVAGSQSSISGDGVSIFLEEEASLQIDTASSRLVLSAPSDGSFAEHLIINRSTGLVAIANNNANSKLEGLIYAPTNSIFLRLNDVLQDNNLRILAKNIEIQAVNVNWSLAPSQGPVSD